MTCLRQQMHGRAGGKPRVPREDSSFDMLLVEEDLKGGYCQLQFYIGPREGFGTTTVDWGDGTVEHVGTQRVFHNYSEPGRYALRIGAEARWFRLWEGYTVNAQGRTSYCRPQIWLNGWSDTLESCEGTFCGWSDPTHGGLKGTVPEWGPSITDTSCCFERCSDLEGGFAEWTDAVTDAAGTYQHTNLAGRIPAWGKNIVRAGSCYANCPNAVGPFVAWPERCVEFGYCYENCTGLSGPLPPWPETAEDLNNAYTGCTGATGTIPPWPPNVKNTIRCYHGCTGLTGAWTTDPAELMPMEKVRYAPDSDFYRCYDCVEDASEALRSIFWDSWGGDIPQPS